MVVPAVDEVRMGPCRVEVGDGDKEEEDKVMFVALALV